MRICFNSIRLESIYYFSYVIMLFGWMFEKVIILNKILPYIRFFSYILLIVIIIYNYKRFSCKKLLMNLIITLVVIVSSINSDSNTILTLWLFILASERIEFKKIVKVDLISKIIFTIMIIILFFLGLTQDIQFYTYSGVARSSLGFGNPNTFGYYVFSICADFMYLKSKKINLFHFISLIGIAFLVINVSESRTSSYLIILLGAIAYFSNKFSKIVLSRFFKKILLSLFIILSILSYSIPKNYDSSNQFYSELNRFLSGRIVNSCRYIEKYDIKILGQAADVTNASNTITYYLDNAYLKLLINYGFLIYLLIMIIYMKMIKKAGQEGNGTLLMIIFIYLIYGISENVMFWLTGNVFLLYVFCSKNIENYKKEKKGICQYEQN